MASDCVSGAVVVVVGAVPGGFVELVELLDRLGEELLSDEVVVAEDGCPGITVTKLSTATPKASPYRNRPHMSETPNA